MGTSGEYRRTLLCAVGVEPVTYGSLEPGLKKHKPSVARGPRRRPRSGELEWHGAGAELGGELATNSSIPTNHALEFNAPAFRPKCSLSHFPVPECLGTCIPNASCSSGTSSPFHSRLPVRSSAGAHSRQTCSNQEHRPRTLASPPKFPSIARSGVQGKTRYFLGVSFTLSTGHPCSRTGRRLRRRSSVWRGFATDGKSQHRRIERALR